MSLSAGGVHGCALEEDGRAYCWGHNGESRLGDGTSTFSSAPVEVQGTAFRHVHGGYRHTCALRDRGELYCWGWNYHGQLGLGFTSQAVVVPTLVPGLAEVVGLGSGHSHQCALEADGTVRCSGSNDHGQLGDGTTTARSSFVPVAGLPPATAIAGGWSHTCAVVESGDVYCWGYNLHGELGDGSTTDRSSPVRVLGLGGPVASISLGRYSSCALREDSEVLCWGRNIYGQLGDGSLINRPTPARVTGL